MVRRLASIGVCVAVVLLGVWPAAAAPMTWVFDGVMKDDGTSFSGSFTVEVTPAVLAEPATFFTSERSVYYSAIRALSLEVGGDEHFSSNATHTTTSMCDMR